MWVYIVIGLLVTFLSSDGKKPTMRDAALGVAAGLGTYYVGTQTEIGRSTVASIESALGGGGTSSVSTSDGVSTTTATTADGVATVGIGSALASGAASLVPVAAAAAGGVAVAQSDFVQKWLPAIGAVVLGWFVLGRSEKEEDK